MSHTLQCPCGSCGTNIEFPAEYSGQRVACPSCSNETLLAAPASNPRQAPERRTQNTMLVCPSCGSTNRLRQQECEYCGTTLLLETEPELTATAENLGDGILVRLSTDEYVDLKTSSMEEIRAAVTAVAERPAEGYIIIEDEAHKGRSITIEPLAGEGKHMNTYYEEGEHQKNRGFFNQEPLSLTQALEIVSSFFHGGKEWKSATKWGPNDKAKRGWLW